MWIQHELMILRQFFFKFEDNQIRIIRTETRREEKINSALTSIRLLVISSEKKHGMSTDPAL